MSGAETERPRSERRPAPGQADLQAGRQQRKAQPDGHVAAQQGQHRPGSGPGGLAELGEGAEGGHGGGRHHGEGHQRPHHEGGGKPGIGGSGPAERQQEGKALHLQGDGRLLRLHGEQEAPGDKHAAVEAQPQAPLAAKQPRHDLHQILPIFVGSTLRAKDAKVKHLIVRHLNNFN